MIIQAVTFIGIIALVLAVYVSTFFRDSLEGKPPRIKTMLVVGACLVFCLIVLIRFPQVSLPSELLAISASVWLIFTIFNIHISRKIKITLLLLSSVGVGYVVVNAGTQTSQTKSNPPAKTSHLGLAQ